jgi:protein import protein ZIM17
VPGARHGGDKFIMLYTCSVCETRSARTISKLAYSAGVVIVRCPGCANLHLVADRLGYFDDASADIQSILAAKGQAVRGNVTLPPTAAAARAASATATGASGSSMGAGDEAGGGGGGGDGNVIELSAADVQLLLSRTKSIRLSDGAEVEAPASATANAPAPSAKAKHER